MNCKAGLFVSTFPRFGPFRTTPADGGANVWDKVRDKVKFCAFSQ